MNPHCGRFAAFPIPVVHSYPADSESRPSIPLIDRARAHTAYDVNEATLIPETFMQPRRKREL
jgi:hypothetical protein